jgi:transcriptional regulator with XRE-family HTH domain
MLLEANMYLVEENELQKLKSLSLGKRVRWIRKKAAEINDEQSQNLFSIYRIAEQTGIAQSTISKIESEDAKEPKAWVLEKIAAYLGISIEVFFDAFYEHPRRFTICGYGKDLLEKDNGEYEPFNLLDSRYEAYLTLSIITSSGDLFEGKSLNEKVDLSTLEIQEFYDEIVSLIEKVRRRRKLWKSQQAAVKTTSLAQKKNN